MYLLDTDVVSQLRRPERADPRLLSWAEASAADEQFLSSITVHELELGVRLIERRDPEQGRRLRRWLEDVVLAAFAARVLPIDTAVARRCAALHVPDPRPARDAFIAATALVHGLTVVTRNVRDFAPMGVELLDPAAGK
jgi:predicted nucleic acid-binding protein